MENTHKSSGVTRLSATADKDEVDPPYVPSTRKPGVQETGVFPPIKSSINLEHRELIESGERVRCITESFQPLGPGDVAGRQRTSYGDTSDIFVIIWDNKKKKRCNKKQAGGG